ncbi:hypothetical protein Tco_0500733 [Tanacetum coccineum]
MLADSKLPTMFWTEAARTMLADSKLPTMLVTSPHNKTPYALLTGNIPSVGHFKPFGCHVTILNTSDHLGKFDGKADEGYNVPNKRVEETMNLRYLEEKPNVQGLGHEWTASLFSDNATHADLTKLDYIYTKLMTLKLDSLVRIILLLSP